MFPKSVAEIETEAKKLGAMAHARSAPDNEIVQVLCALVEELAHHVDRIEREFGARISPNRG